MLASSFPGHAVSIGPSGPDEPSHVRSADHVGASAVSRSGALRHGHLAAIPALPHDPRREEAVSNRRSSARRASASWSATSWCGVTKCRAIASPRVRTSFRRRGARSTRDGGLRRASPIPLGAEPRVSARQSSRPTSRWGPGRATPLGSGRYGRRRRATAASWSGIGGASPARPGGGPWTPSGPGSYFGALGTNWFV
jgi:hypothetical protein